MRSCSLLRPLITIGFLFSSLAIARQPELFYHHTLQRGGLLSRLNSRIGDPIDLSERRPVVSLEGTIFEDVYGARPGFRLLANVSHQRQFWIARVPEEGAQSVYLMFSMFSKLAAHVFLRFDLNTPVELIAQMPKDIPEARDWVPSDLMPALDQPILLKQVAMTSEAQWTTTDSRPRYSLIRGALGQFVQITRMVSMEERFRNFLLTRNPTAQLAVHQTPEQASRALMTAIGLSEIDGANTYYNTLFHNCSTTSVDLLQGSSGRTRLPSHCLTEFFKNRVLTVSRSIPILERVWGARARGLISPDTPLTWMHEDPALQSSQQNARRFFLKGSGASGARVQEAADSKKRCEF